MPDLVLPAPDDQVFCLMLDQIAACLFVVLLQQCDMVGTCRKTCHRKWRHLTALVPAPLIQIVGSMADGNFLSHTLEKFVHVVVSAEMRQQELYVCLTKPVRLTDCVTWPQAPAQPLMSVFAANSDCTCARFCKFMWRA